MSEKVNKLLNDSPAIRWTALVLIAMMMFFAYLFADILSPLKSTLENLRGWDSATFGTYAGGEYFLNVFCFFLIFAGIILDKMGVRRSEEHTSELQSQDGRAVHGRAERLAHGSGRRHQVYRRQRLVPGY